MEADFIRKISVATKNPIGGGSLDGLRYHISELKRNFKDAAASAMKYNPDNPGRIIATDENPITLDIVMRLLKPGDKFLFWYKDGTWCLPWYFHEGDFFELLSIDSENGLVKYKVIPWPKSSSSWGFYGSEHRLLCVTNFSFIERIS